jgi:hypothetical protein
MLDKCFTLEPHPLEPLIFKGYLILHLVVASDIF